MTSMSGLRGPAEAAARADWDVRTKAAVAPLVDAGRPCLGAEQLQLLLKQHSLQRRRSQSSSRLLQCAQTLLLECPQSSSDPAAGVPVLLAWPWHA